MTQDKEMERLVQVRHELIHLHKTLLDYQKDLYEKKHGRVRSETEFFKLVTEHKAFAWIRPLSMLIVSIDEAQEADFISPREIQALRRRSQLLTRPVVSNTDFAKKLDRALQSSPDVVMALGGVSRLLKDEVTQ